jgi:hypothetical protein
MCSAKAANAIIEHIIAINWGKVDDRLLHLVVRHYSSRVSVGADKSTVSPLENIVRGRGTSFL